MMAGSSGTTTTAMNTMKISTGCRKRPARTMLASAAAGALALASFSGEQVLVSAQDATQDAPENNNNYNEIRTAPGSGSSGNGIEDEGQQASTLAGSLALYDLSRLDYDSTSSGDYYDYPSCDALTDVFGSGAACPPDDAVPCSGIKAVTEHCRGVLLHFDNDGEDVDPAALRGCIAYVGWHDGALACCPSTSCFDAFHDQMDGEDGEQVEEEDEDFDYDDEDDADDDDEEEDGWEFITLSPHEPVPEVGTPYFDDAEDEPISFSKSTTTTTSTSSDNPESSPSDVVDSADFDTATNDHGDKDASTSTSSGDTYQFDPIADADELRIFLRIMAADLTPAEIDEVERRLYEHYYPDGEKENYDEDYGYEDIEEEDYEEDSEDDAAANGSNNNNLLVNETRDVEDPTTTDTSAATKNFSTDEAVVDISRRAGQQRTDQ